MGASFTMVSNNLDIVANGCSEAAARSDSGMIAVGCPVEKRIASVEVAAGGPNVVSSCNQGTAATDTLDTAGGGVSNAVSKCGGSEISGVPDATKGSHFTAAIDSCPYTVASGRSSATAGRDSGPGTITGCGLVVKETVCDILAAGVLIVVYGRNSYTVVRCTMAPTRMPQSLKSQII